MKGQDRLGSNKTGKVLAYDARFSLGQYRGMGHYLRTLIAGRESELLGLCATDESDSSLNLVASGFRFYPLWEQISIPRLLSNHKVNIFLAPYNTAPLFLPKSIKLVVIVHDLIFLDNAPLSRSLYQNVGRIYRRFIVPRAIRRADLVLTCSQYTARHLISRFALDESRIRVIPNSIAPDWFSSEPVEPATPPYILAVAGEAPSKNLNRALAAFARCRALSQDRALRFKVAGVKEKFHPAFQAESAALGIANYVDFLGYISESAMHRLFQQAALFIMPSLAEGFGIPILEAMASGVPVAASSATSLPEVAGTAAVYFDPYSTDDMAATMNKILSDSALQASMSAKGRIQSQQFHPDAAGLKVSQFWAELCEIARIEPGSGSAHL
jgi:glycosyltransferase involved in cell wall biosynthesis